MMLTFIKNVSSKGGNKMGLYQCSCGKTKEISIRNVKNNATLSCGCLQKQRASKASKVHGGYKTSEYIIWKGIKQRTLNPKHKSYFRYGGKGITICDEWKNNFANFLNDMGFRPSDNHSIERLDNKKGYFKSNCKWGTDEEQANNKSNNRYLTYNNKTQNLQQWSKELNINHRVLRRRLKLGWTDEEILTTEKRKRT